MPKNKEDNLLSEINITAPVYFPPRDSLAINLVSTDLVYRLEEYRSDEKRFETILFTIIGAIIGVVVNWATTEPLMFSKTSIVIIILLSIFAVLSGIAMRDYRSRANQIKTSMLSQNKIDKAIAAKSDEVTVSVFDSVTGKNVRAKVPSNVPMSRLIPALVKKIQLSSDIGYEFLHIDSNSVLKDSDTLNSQNVEDENTLWLIPKNKILVKIIDVVSGETIPAELPGNVPISRLGPIIATKIKLSSVVVYSLQHLETATTLNDDTTLVDAGVKAGDTLRLFPFPKIETG